MAYTPIDPTVLTGVLNNQGTLATEVTSSAILSEITSGTTQVAITYSDTPLFDAFGRLRTSNPTTLFDGKLTLDAAPQFWDDAQTSGSGTTSTYSRLRASVTLAVSNLTAGTRVRQSKRWFDYQPGKSQLIYATFVLGSAATGITRRVGYFSTNNGIFLEQTATALSFVIRTWISGTPSDVNTVAQTAWNIDKLDGTGPSGLTLDVTKAQILFIDFEWLGVGRVRCGFLINGLYVPCHQFLNANVGTSVFTGSPNQPIRYSITNDGTGPAAAFEIICSTVISEGGRSPTGYERGVSRTSNPVDTGNNSFLHPVIAMRLNGSYLGATINVTGMALGCTTNSAFNWYVIENPTITGGSLVFTTVNNSAVEVDVLSGGSLIAAASTGTILATGFAATADEAIFQSTSEMQLGSYINGTSDIWVLCVQKFSGASETFYGALNWRETGA